MFNKLYTDDYYGWNFYDNNNSIFEDPLYDYHGTYIATTITKVSPSSRILSVKFLNSTLGTAEDSILAIQYAIDMGAKIINCSWNFNEKDDAFSELIKNNPQVLFVCAAGNSNADLDVDKLYPCSYNFDNLITVMSIDNKGQPYDSSGFGKNTVDIAAPGVDVKVTLPENEQSLISGTSVSTAFVSGTASLLIALDSTLSPKEIKEIINSNAQKTNELSSLCKSGGFLDIGACLQAAKKQS